MSRIVFFINPNSFKFHNLIGWDGISKHKFMGGMEFIKAEANNILS